MSNLRSLWIPIAIYFAGAGAGGPVGRPPADTPSALHSDALTAIAPDAVAAQAAVDRLRANGPAGLDALLDEHKAVLDRGAKDPQWSRVNDAIDKVAAQKDAFASRLYWYTDLEQAKAAARASGRPILSLRLLGRLDQDLSCANSRFFRTSLYADPRVSALMRENFVLHWESERPAPKITIDFGDGRTLERTVTGNSVHYVLDAEGRPVDAIPGLTGAGIFKAELADDAQLERSLRGLSPAERAARLAKYHAIKRAVLNEELPAFMVDAQPRGEGAPTALAASPRAYTKALEQMPLVRTISPLEAAPPALETSPELRRLINRHRAGAQLAPQCVALMRLKEGPGSGAARDEEAFARLVRTYSEAIARDQVTNQYVLHARIHGWFAEKDAKALRLASLDARIYDELFLTPSSDPWLGLMPADAYAGIDDGGIRIGGQSLQNQ
jgi:hypothetical protein